MNKPDKFEKTAANAQAITKPSSQSPPKACAVEGITILLPLVTRSFITAELASPEMKMARPTIPK